LGQSKKNDLSGLNHFLAASYCSFKEIQDKGDFPADHYMMVGAVSRLKGYGFFKTEFQQFNFDGSDNSFDEIVSITDFGQKFVKYCLQKNLSNQAN
jgi:hypothetical protein